MHAVALFCSANDAVVKTKKNKKTITPQIEIPLLDIIMMPPLYRI
jgi:hypothetical protein